MIPAFSQIAWNPEEDAAAHRLLRKHGVQHIEIPPGRVFSRPNRPDAEEVQAAREGWAAEGVAIAGFQAILFGRPEFTVFESAEARAGLQEFMEGIITTCRQVGGSYLVFGAPKNRRVPEGAAAGEIHAIARTFFAALGAAAAQAGVTVGLEANPVAYGCNFCTRAEEVIALVSEINSPGLRWHLDTGELIMNNADLDAVLALGASWIGSVHVSQPNLAPFDPGWIGHRQIADHLCAARYGGYVSVEMKRDPAGLAAVDAAVAQFLSVYFC